MTYATGSRLASYEIVGPLGAGGMGEVYRARDAKLNRDVAVKVLPDLFAADADRFARFEREARALAALNHPGIAQIYGFEDRVLVMELVEGETLGEQLARRPLSWEEARPIAAQIAAALEFAHDRGIVHRDLKPANIKVTPDGLVKILDFGLAKAMATDSTSGDLMNSPTLSVRATEAGLVLGTAAYMAPEQARGRAVDKRADIWAFGVVLFEMLTGRQLFEGETATDVVAAVLTQPIDLGVVPAIVPGRVRDLIARCLERDPKRRLRDIGEARLALEAPVGASSPGFSGVHATGESDSKLVRRSTILPWGIAAAAVVAALATGAFAWRAAGISPSPARFSLEIGPPAAGPFIVGSNAGGATISPDGSTVAFIAQAGAGRRLFLRSLATGETRELSGTADVHYPFWSPDSRAIAFFGTSKMFRVDIAGGLPEAIADIIEGRGGTWTDTGEILFTPEGGGTVHRVSSAGGAVQQVTTLDTNRGENAHYWPEALPGGRKFLFFIRSTRPENNGIYLGSLDGAAHVRLVTSLSSGIYAPAQGNGLGHLLWARDGELLAQTLDVESGTLTGEVTTIASDVRVDESQRGLLASVSTGGTLVWASARAGDLTFGWYDRAGRRLNALPLAPGKIMQPRISPDGKRLSFTRAAAGTADIWLHDFQTGATTQVTTDPDYDENAEWTPDGRVLAYQGSTATGRALVVTTIDGSDGRRSIAPDERASTGRFHAGQPTPVVFAFVLRWSRP